MTEKSLLQLALPLVVSFTTRFLFAFVDMAFAAGFLERSKAAVAAIGFYTPFQALYIALWVGLSGGLTAALSNAFGHRDEQRVADLKRAMLRFLYGLVPVLLLLGAGFWFALPRLGLGLEPDVLAEARVYCTTMLVGMPLTGFWAILPDSIVKAHHDTRSTMIAGLLSSFVNVALNALFLLVFGLGIFGIALATVVSRLPSLAYALHRTVVLERRRRAEQWTGKRASWPPPLRTILTLAVPGALTFGLTSLEHGVVIGVLTGLPDSTTALASFAVFERVLSLSLMPAAGTAVAVVPFAARLLPMGLVDRVRTDMLRTMAVIASLSLLVTVLVGWVFPEPVAAFFVRNGDGAAPSPLTLLGLRLLPLAALATVPFYLFRPLFEAAQRPGLGVRVALVRYLGLSVPLLLLSQPVARALDWNGFAAVIGSLATAAGLASLLAVAASRAVWAEARATGS